MRKILHVIKRAEDPYAWGAVRRSREEADGAVTVLLLHDAAAGPCPEEGVRVVAGREEVAARGGETRAELVDYEEMVRILLDADSVICW